MITTTSVATPLRLTASRSGAAVLVMSLVVVAGCVRADDLNGAVQPERAEPSVAAPVTPDPPKTTPDPEEPQQATPAARATIAEAVVPTVAIMSQPGGDDPIHVLDHPTPIGAPLTFLVDEQNGDWLRVLLPVRPNGSTGWLRRDDVALTVTSYRLEVELSGHRLRLFEDERVRLEVAIGVGGDGTPTPPGRYYITELLQPPDPTGPYGPFAFGLSGFSEVHLDFAGGQGVIGIHGTDDPSSIGRDASNGCIRVDNDVITELAGWLPLGTPVEIFA